MDDETSAERLTIREELSNMTFEELLKLKQELGGKAYNEAVFGVRRTRCTFKRQNKNRPREMSSKTPAPVSQEVPLPKKALRDPRFDPLCGQFVEEFFRKKYSFINEIKVQEIEQLREQLKVETNEDKKEQIQYLITRMENQEREKKRHEAKQARKKEEHNAHIEMLRHGKKPQFQKKSEERVLNLVQQYEELKKSGKLMKHIEKQRRKTAGRDRKKLNVIP